MSKVKQFFSREWHDLRSTLSKVNPLVMTFFVLAIVAMNLLASKSIDLSWIPGNNGDRPWLALDCGILVSWLAFFAMDNMVTRLNAKASTQMTIVAVFVNLIICGVFLAAGSIPGLWGVSFMEDGSINEAANIALDSTISGTWYVLMGSTIAFIASAIVHGITSTAVRRIFKDKESLKAYAICSAFGTSLGQFVDNMIFALIVSLNFFGWNLLQCAMCSLTGMFVEFLLSIIFVPIGHKVYKSDLEKQKQQESMSGEEL